MTREEAIEAIKCNWPDSRYTILREALDMAISALRQQGTVTNCNGLNEPLTNAQKIRAMSDEDLAEFLIDLADDGNLRIREWLQQPAEEDGHDERKENENA